MYNNVFQIKQNNKIYDKIGAFVLKVHRAGKTVHRAGARGAGPPYETSITEYVTFGPRLAPAPARACAGARAQSDL